MTLEEILSNLRGAVDKYQNLPLDEVRELSEVLKIISVNLSYMVFLRNETYNKWQSVHYNSQAKTDAAKTRESDQKVPELYHIRQVMKTYSDLQNNIRSQISLHKKHD